MLTPCEEKGYKVGDRFTTKEGPIGASFNYFTDGSTVELIEDDNTEMPGFALVEGEILQESVLGENKAYLYLGFVTPV